MYTKKNIKILNLLKPFKIGKNIKFKNSNIFSKKILNNSLFLNWRLKFKIFKLRQLQINDRYLKINKKKIGQKILKYISLKTKKIRVPKKYIFILHKTNNNNFLFNISKLHNNFKIKTNPIFFKKQLYNSLKSKFNLLLWNNKTYLNKLKIQQKIQYKILPNYFTTITHLSNFKTLFWKTDIAKLYFQNIDIKNEININQKILNYDKYIQKFIPFFINWKYNLLKKPKITFIKTTPLKIKQQFKKINLFIERCLQINNKKYIKKAYITFLKNYKNQLINKKNTNLKKEYLILKKAWFKKLQTTLMNQKYKNYILLKFLKKLNFKYIWKANNIIQKYLLLRQNIKQNKPNKIKNIDFKFIKLEQYTFKLTINKPIRFPFLHFKNLILNNFNLINKTTFKNILVNFYQKQLQLYNTIYSTKLINTLQTTLQISLPNYFLNKYNLFKINTQKQEHLKNAIFSITKANNQNQKKWDKLEKQNIKKSTQQKFRSSRFYRKFKKYNNILHLQRRKLNNLQFIKKWQRLKHTYSLFKYFKKYYFLKTFPGLKPWEIKKILKFYKKRNTKSLIFLKKKLNQKLIFKLLTLKFLGGLETIKLLLKKKKIALDSYIVTNRYISINDTNLITFNLQQNSILFQYTKNPINREIKWQYPTYFQKFDFIQTLYLNQNKNIQKTLINYLPNQKQILPLKLIFQTNHQLNTKKYVTRFNLTTKTKLIKKYKLLLLKNKINIIKILTKLNKNHMIPKLRKFTFKPFNSKKLLKPFTRNKAQLNTNGSFFKNLWFLNYYKKLNKILTTKYTNKNNLLIVPHNNNKIRQLNFFKNTLQNPGIINNIPQLYTLSTLNTFENKSSEIYPLKFRKFKRKNKKYLRKFITKTSILNPTVFKNTTYNLTKRNWHDITSLKIAITKY